MLLIHVYSDRRTNTGYKVAYIHPIVSRPLSKHTVCSHKLVNCHKVIYKRYLLDYTDATLFG